MMFNPLPDPATDAETHLLRFLLAWTEGQPSAAPAELDDLPPETRQLLAVAERPVLLRLVIEALDRLRDATDDNDDPSSDPRVVN